MLPIKIEVRLNDFDNSWYNPGRGLFLRMLWLSVNRVIFQTHFPWPFKLKVGLLRIFGSRVGLGVVIKPRVNIKYPWNVSIGNHCWIGEGVWIDSLGKVIFGDNVCLSQGCMIETGNHDWSDPKFGLVIDDVVLDDGSWAGACSLLLPGSKLGNHAVLAAGAVLNGDAEPYSIYMGNPAVKKGERLIKYPTGK